MNKIVSEEYGIRVFLDKYGKEDKRLQNLFIEEFLKYAGYVHSNRSNTNFSRYQYIQNHWVEFRSFFFEHRYVLRIEDTKEKPSDPKVIEELKVKHLGEIGTERRNNYENRISKWKNQS